MTTEVTIVDAMCGSGKTSWIIDKMNRENKRWIYITPYLDEVDRIIEAAGYSIRPGNLWLPRNLAYGIGGISEFIAWLWRPIRKYSPKMSRFAVTYTCTDYTFNSEKARRELGFTPKYEEQEAFRRTVDYFSRE